MSGYTLQYAYLHTDVMFGICGNGAYRDPWLNF